MKRNIKITIAAAVLFVVGMAYRSHVNAQVVNSETTNSRKNINNYRGHAGPRLFGAVATVGTVGAIGRAARDDDQDRKGNGRSPRNRWNR